MEIFFQDYKDDEHHFTSVSQLTFSVPKLDRDVIANFEYSKEARLDYAVVPIENPFKICHGKECKENLSTYEFKKGESYEINIKVSNIADRDVIIPGFAFYDQKYNGTYSPDDIVVTISSFGLKAKFLFIYMILLLL